jgi:DNA-binding IclR family transcriptional regulator
VGHAGIVGLSVKKIQSAGRVLQVLEQIAEHQPIGVGDLAAIMGDGKSGLQRAIVTLADSGWIRMAPGKPTRWELTAHIHTIAHKGQGGDSLRQRARAALEALREETGESVVLAVPDVERLVVVEVVESRQMVRTAASVGMVIPARDSASGLIVMSHLDAAGQAALLGETPDAALLGRITAAGKKGYATNDGVLIAGSTNIAAAILESDGRPVGAVIVAAPSERMPKARQKQVAEMVMQTAALLSRGTARSA